MNAKGNEPCPGSIYCMPCTKQKKQSPALWTPDDYKTIVESPKHGQCHQFNVHNVKPWTTMDKFKRFFKIK